MKSTYFSILLIFLSQLLNAQDFKTLKREYEHRKNTAGANDNFIIEFYKENTIEKKLNSNSELFKSMRFLADEASKGKTTIYFELIVNIAARLQDAGYYEEAYYYIYKAVEKQKEVSAIDKDTWKTFTIQTAISRYYFRRFDESRTFFLKAYKLKNLTVYDSLQINNTLGLICRDKDELPCSKYYFTKTLEIAKRNNNNAWIGISSGNLGSYYFTIKNYQKALDYTSIDYQISLKEKEFSSAISALSIIVQTHVALKNLNKAKEELRNLESLLATDNSIANRLEAFLAKEAYLEAIEDYKVLHFTHKALVATQDSLAARRDRENNLRTEFQVRFETEQAKLKLFAERKKRSDQNLLFSAIVFTISTVSLIIIIYQLNRRRKIEKEILRKEKEQLNKDLKNAEKELLGIVKRLMEKNEIIEVLENDLENMQKSIHFKEEEKMELKSKLQTFTLLTDDDWISFKILFEKLNPNFFDKISKLAPDLTNSEIRLFCLIKLNLSITEMSRTLAISVESVRRSSLRLRKKLNLGEHEELVKLIFSL